jgi:hypothetical protein
MSGPTQPDYTAVLDSLKDFQKRTVAYAFQQLYQNPGGSGRFLVADEVGLGKTLVARGVIAKTVEHLWDRRERIDIIYLCSNADIARQNIRRLTIPGLNQFIPAKRITLLPISMRQQNGRNFQNEKVNFIPLTPGTSFHLHSQFGVVEERILLYYALREAVEMPMDGAMQIFSGDAGKARFRYNYVEMFDPKTIDATMKAAFLRELEAEENKALLTDLAQLCQLFQQSRWEVRQANRDRHKAIISGLRGLLARTCMGALQPNLIIMDEFQRFKQLLNQETPAGELAQMLLNQDTARVLLLSATPYKMYTLSDDEEEDHHTDFLETLNFLFDDPLAGQTFRQTLRDYRQSLIQYGNRREEGRDWERLSAAKTAVESRLRQVMARTEKLTASADRNGMFRDVVSGEAGLQSQDLIGYVGLQQVAELIGHSNMLEYWKSAPYLLNFMEGYQFKRLFDGALGMPTKASALAQVLADNPQLLVSQADMANYQALDPGNARLRQLMADMIESGAWQLLWIPPSLPYYRLERPFAGRKKEQLTKRLVFSAWHVVPKAVASLLSYEAERRIMRLFKKAATNELYDSLRGRLQITRSHERLTGMPVLALMYPSPALAELGDPLTHYTRRNGSGLSDATTLLDAVQSEIEKRLAHLPMNWSAAGPADESWYWAAPILLDLVADAQGTRDWWQAENLAALWSGEGRAGEDFSAWAEHVAAAQTLFTQSHPNLGRPPEDLSLTLAQIAVGGLGNIGLRALSRISGGESSLTAVSLRLHAAAIGWAFRSLFNTPEAGALIQGLYKETDRAYWQKVLAYTIAGCLPAVMDEYSHILREALGLVEDGQEGVWAAVAASMRTAIQLRTASLKTDGFDVEPANAPVVYDYDFRWRSHFAQRFGDIHGENDRKEVRKEAVREGFNSPFWPFVLVTTSVGQEGLDFHQYCHAIVHWNLPANPVDLEQREGRVHRYKGHAIRKNVAHDYGASAINENTRDPWQALFAAAQSINGSDLVPFWIYPEKGKARAFIERHTPIMPLSRDAHRLLALRRGLTIYRMVLGQNRQEDLVDYLLNRLTDEEINRLMTQMQIDLQPPDVSAAVVGS